MSLLQNLQSFKDTQSLTLLQSSHTAGALGLIKQHKIATVEVIALMAVLGIATVSAVSIQLSSADKSEVNINKHGITQSVGVKSASTADSNTNLNSLGEFTVPDTSAATGTDTATISSSVVVNGQSMPVPAAGTTTQTVISPDGSGKTNVTITSNQSSTAGSTNNNDSSPDFPNDSYSHSTLRVTTRSSAQTKSTDSLNGSGVSP